MQFAACGNSGGNISPLYPVFIYYPIYKLTKLKIPVPHENANDGGTRVFTCRREGLDLPGLN